MPEQEVFERIISNSLMIDNYKLQTNSLTQEERDLVMNFSNKSLPNLIIDDKAEVDLFYIQNKIKHSKAIFKKIGIEKDIIVFIDYLNILELESNDKKRTREQEIARATKKLKSMSKSEEVALCLYAQLNRAVETRGGDKKPCLADLKDSGAIEQDADVVTFLHRPEYYGFTEDANGNSTVGKIELIHAKNRGGKLGVGVSTFLPQYYRIINERSETYIEPTEVNSTNNFKIPIGMKPEF